jgi:hypothetical protein
MDIGSGRASRRKLTVIIGLNHSVEYEGGGTQIFYGNNLSPSIKLGVGEALVILSYVMHRACPVLSGERWDARVLVFRDNAFSVKPWSAAPGFNCATLRQGQKGGNSLSRISAGMRPPSSRSRISTSSPSSQVVTFSTGGGVKAVANQTWQDPSNILRPARSGGLPGGLMRLTRDRDARIREQP